MVRVFIWQDIWEQFEAYKSSVFLAVVSSMNVFRSGSQSSYVLSWRLCSHLSVILCIQFIINKHILVCPSFDQIGLETQISTHEKYFFIQNLCLELYFCFIGNIFLFMFEICKKVEVYNIQHNYFFNYGPSHIGLKRNARSFQLLKPNPINSIRQANRKQQLSPKKGLRLESSLTNKNGLKGLNSQISKDEIQQPGSRNKDFGIFKEKQEIQSEDRNEQDSKIQQNKRLIQSLYQKSEKLKIVNMNKKKKHKCWHSQKIQKKEKLQFLSLVAHLDKKDSKLVDEILSLSNKESNKVNFDLKPVIESKNQTQTQACSTYGFQSDKYINCKHYQQKHSIFSQIQENSSSKLISISKSISSMHQTANDGIKHQEDYKNENQRLSFLHSRNNFQISLSNIQSRDDGSDYKKFHRSTSQKRLSMFLDSDRHTIESRIQRQLELIDDMSFKVQQSVICARNPKQHFETLQFNKITNKDYVLSQAIQSRLGLLVSLKEFVDRDIKSMIHQLHVYKILENSRKQEEKSIFHQLYQVQIGENSHILIKEPYQMSLTIKLKKVSSEIGNNLKQKAKQSAIRVLKILQKYHLYPIRKITSQQFVVLGDDVKFHHFDVFQEVDPCKLLLNQEQVISGIDIY